MVTIIFIKLISSNLQSDFCSGLKGPTGFSTPPPPPPPTPQFFLIAFLFRNIRREYKVLLCKSSLPLPFITWLLTNHWNQEFSHLQRFEYLNISFNLSCWFCFTIQFWLVCFSHDEKLI